MQWRSYWRPTPRKWRKLGDSIFAGSTVITGAAIMEEFKLLALITLCIGALGKFLTEFFEDEPTPNDKMRAIINDKD